jgi:2-amino-4-hydroxy-6-hydroxymethyldihydropteridine diphosphokinase
MPRVYLGLGANVGDRLAALRAAVRRLAALGDVTVVGVSRLYETEPWETEPGTSAADERWDLSGVVSIDTSLDPLALLAQLRAIEDALGRSRPPLTPEAGRFEPRAIDIDILLYGDRVISVPDELHVPHLLLAERGFALRPLAEVAPDLVHPTLYVTMRQLADELEDEHAVRPSPHPAAWFGD